MELATGIDIGGTSIKAVLVDRNGTVLRQAQTPTPPTASEIIATAADLADHYDTTAVGVAVSGIVDEATGIAASGSHLPWAGHRLGESFSRAVGRPVAVGHDVRCGARAELAWGVATPNTLYIAVGTGLSAAVLRDGTPMPGQWMGEIGQPRVPDPSHPGEFVALEHVASARAIARRYDERRPGVLPSRAGALEVFDLLRAGDSCADAVIGEATDALAAALVAACALVAPDRIVVAGGLAQAGTALTQRLSAAMDRRSGGIPLPPLMIGRLGVLAQAMGAAALAWSRRRPPIG